MNKKKVELQKILFPLLYIIMYKTEWGLKKMDSIAKRLKKHRDKLTYTSISVGFLGMLVIVYSFGLSVYKYFFVEKTQMVAPLLPGADVPGLPHLSFIHWIIAIFVLATVHEFAHGIFARLYDIKIKSSGFAIFGLVLPIIPAAFVEPDEEQMEKKSKKAQLAVMSGGAFSNFIFAGIFFLILALIMAPITGLMTEEKGVIIAGIDEGGPAEIAGMQVGEIIISINGDSVKTTEEILTKLNQTGPYEKITLSTENNPYSLTLAQHPQGENKGYMGLSLALKIGLSENISNTFGRILFNIFMWFSILINWLFITNLMVGLVNLLPIGIVDGGRMFSIALSTVIKDEKKSKLIFSIVSLLLLAALLFFLIPALLKYFAAPFLN